MRRMGFENTVTSRKIDGNKDRGYKGENCWMDWLRGMDKFIKNTK